MDNALIQASRSLEGAGGLARQVGKLLVDAEDRGGYYEIEGVDPEDLADDLLKAAESVRKGLSSMKHLLKKVR